MPSAEAQRLEGADDLRRRTAAAPSGCTKYRSQLRPISTSTFKGDEPLTRPEHIAALIELMQRPGRAGGNVKDSRGALPTSTIRAAVKVVTDSAGGRCIFPAPRFPTIATAPGPPISNISAFMPIASRLWTDSWRCRSQRSSAASGWSSCASWKMESRFTSPRPPHDTVGVDTEEDLRRVENILQSM